MKIGIIGAMEVEVSMLKEKMTDVRKSHFAGMDFYDGVLEGVPVVVSRCGVGKVNAAMCVQALCDRFSVTHIINSGVAGSLSDELKILDVVVSRDAMYHDMDAVGFGYALGQVPGMDCVEFTADDTLIGYTFAAAESYNPGHTKIGRVASGDQFVCNSEQKQRIREQTQALCTEMEGAAIAQACTKNGVPFVIIRAISDAADETVSWDYFEGKAAECCSHVTCAVMQQLAEAEME